MANRFPPLRMTAEELMALPEYSCSIPTGTTPGKRWRRHEGRAILVGEYFTLTGDEAEKWPGEIGVRWYRPLITVTAILVRPRPWWLFADWGRPAWAPMVAQIEESA